MEPVGLLSVGLQRVRHDWVGTHAFTNDLSDTRTFSRHWIITYMLLYVFKLSWDLHTCVTQAAVWHSLAGGVSGPRWCHLCLSFLPNYGGNLDDPESLLSHQPQLTGQGWFLEAFFSISEKLDSCQKAAGAQKHHEKINLWLVIGNKATDNMIHTSSPPCPILVSRLHLHMHPRWWDV